MIATGFKKKKMTYKIATATSLQRSFAFFCFAGRRIIASPLTFIMIACAAPYAATGGFVGNVFSRNSSNGLPFGQLGINQGQTLHGPWETMRVTTAKTESATAAQAREMNANLLRDLVKLNAEYCSSHSVLWGDGDVRKNSPCDGLEKVYNQLVVMGAGKIVVETVDNQTWFVQYVDSPRQGIPCTPTGCKYRVVDLGPKLPPPIVKAQTEAQLAALNKFIKKFDCWGGNGGAVCESVMRALGFFDVKRPKVWCHAFAATIGSADGHMVPKSFVQEETKRCLNQRLWAKCDPITHSCN
ncbi:MAG: hypothetical protein WA624_22020 [Methylocella sp.]